MAQYIEDWSGHDLGVGVPAGWVRHWETGANFLRLEIAENPLAPSGKCLNISVPITSNTRKGIYWDALTSEYPLEVFDAIALVRSRGAPAAGGAAGVWGLSGRGSGLTSTMQANTGLITGGVAGTGISSTQYTGGALNSAVVSYAVDPDELYWLRLTVNNDTAICRLYAYDDPKGTPLATSENSAVPVGSVSRTGLFSFRSEVDADILWYGIGTGEDEAPLPGEEPVDPPQGTVTITDIAPGQETATVTYGYNDTDATGFQYRIDNGPPAAIGSSPATISGLTEDTDYDSPGLQIRAVNSIGSSDWSAPYPFSTSAPGTDIEVVWDTDAGNIAPGSIVIENPESDTPTIHVKPRNVQGGSVFNWIHWHFKIVNALGKRPIFKVDVASRNFAAYYGSWRPQYTYDFETWVSAPSRTIVSNIATFQWDDPFTEDEVYLGDHPIFRLQDFKDLAAAMAADTSGLISPSSAADEDGVIGVSPQETDDLGRQVGNHPVFGFVLGDDRPTDDGGPKRWMIVDGGCHAGEILDGFPLRGLVDFYVNGTGAQANKLRSNWKIGCYFALTPNGRYGGHYRTNWRIAQDPNRDWIAGRFNLAESVIARDAMLADLGGSIESVGISLHTAAGAATLENIWRQTTIPDQTIQDAWLSNLDLADDTPWNHVDTAIAESVTGWHVARGAVVGLISEFSTRGTHTVERLEEIGRRYLEATALTDAQGLFYQGGDQGGSTAFVTVSAQGSGIAQEHAVGGTTASVAVNAAGQGVAAEHSVGRSTAQVVVTASGAGQASGSEQGGSSASVTVSATGAGASVEVAQGGSTAQVSVSAQGAGFAGSDQTGGSTSAVTVSATGAGTGHESAQGGATATVSVIAEGAGIPSTGQSGGSSSNVIVLATGQGIAREHALGGSTAGITVTATGAGESSEGQSNQGGSTAQILAFPSGSGVAIERAEGGSTAGVRVKALGHTAPSFDGPAILFEVPAEGRVAIVDRKRA